MNTIKFMSGLLTFYLKGEISTDQNFLSYKKPNTILALIPLGAKSDSIPVTQITTVSSNFKLLVKSFLIGLIITILSFVLMGQGGSLILVGLILLVIGASNIINSFRTELGWKVADGTEYTLSFLIFEKAKAEQAAKMIREMINARLNDTNNRQVTEAQTNVLVDAISGLKNQQ